MSHTLFGLSYRLVLSIVGLLLALRCNQNRDGSYQPYAYLKAAIAFFFPEVYLIVYATRKYILGEEICTQLNRK